MIDPSTSKSSCSIINHSQPLLIVPKIHGCQVSLGYCQSRFGAQQVNACVLMCLKLDMFEVLGKMDFYDTYSYTKKIYTILNTYVQKIHHVKQKYMHIHRCVIHITVPSQSFARSIWLSVTTMYPWVYIPKHEHHPLAVAHFLVACYWPIPISS